MLGASLAGVVVARIVECTKHPEADKLQVCRVDAGLPAHSAGTGRIEVPCGRRRRRRGAVGQCDVQNVVGVAPATGTRSATVDGGAELVPAGDDGFGNQEAGGEFDVAAGRAHGDGQWATADPDLQRLFDGQDVRDAVLADADDDFRHRASRRDTPHAARLLPDHRVPRRDA